MSWCIYLLGQKSVFCGEMVFMFDFHLLKNGFSKEGIFLMLITVGNTICHLSTMATFLSKQIKPPPFQHLYNCYLLLSKNVAPWQVSIVFRKRQKGNGAPTSTPAKKCLLNEFIHCYLQSFCFMAENLKKKFCKKVCYLKLCLRQLVAHGSDQLKSLSSYGHTHIFVVTSWNGAKNKKSEIWNLLVLRKNNPIIVINSHGYYKHHKCCY